MKIQLQSLRAINCGPLRDVCIHFNTDGDSPTTVLAGANGSGKTTALELIVGLAEMLLPLSELPPLRPALAQAEYAQMDLLVDGKEFGLFFGQKPTGTVLPENFFGRSGVIGDFTDEYQGEIVSVIRARIHQQETHANVDPFDIISEDDNRRERPYLTVPSVLFFPHTRVLLPVTGDQLHKEEVAYQWVYFYQIISEFKGSLDSYLVWLDYVEQDSYESAIHFLNELNIDGKTFSIRRKDLKVLVKASNGGIHFLESMSSGEQNILILLLELRRRVLPHSIVLIDEIENSLHQAFQKKLAQALKRMQEQTPFQLIVTTHSVPIVESFGPASVRVLTEF